MHYASKNALKYTIRDEITQKSVRGELGFNAPHTQIAVIRQTVAQHEAS